MTQQPKPFDMPLSVLLLLRVSAAAGASPERVCFAVQRLIDIGLADAAATLANGEGDLEGARLAVNLNIGCPEVVTGYPGPTNNRFLNDRPWIRTLNRSQKHPKAGLAAATDEAQAVTRAAYSDRGGEAPPLKLTPSQVTVLKTYAGGDFAHLIGCSSEETFQEELRKCGDSLLRFLMAETSVRESCLSDLDALGRIATAVRELEEVHGALEMEPEWTLETP